LGPLAGRTLRLDRSKQRSMLKRLAARIGMKTAALCHSYGMVGFVKELIDEPAAYDVTRKNWTGKSTRASKFASITIVPSMVMVRKAQAHIVLPSGQATWRTS
jgi:hypothetical protein